MRAKTMILTAVLSSGLLVGGFSGTAAAWGRQSPAVGGRLDYTCEGLSCSCSGEADCEDMFDDLDCLIDWVDETGDVVGYCIIPSPRLGIAHSQAQDDDESADDSILDPQVVADAVVSDVAADADSESSVDDEAESDEDSAPSEGAPSRPRPGAAVGVEGSVAR